MGSTLRGERGGRRRGGPFDPGGTFWLRYSNNILGICSFSSSASLPRSPLDPCHIRGDTAKNWKPGMGVISVAVNVLVLRISSGISILKLA